VTGVIVGTPEGQSGRCGAIRCGGAIRTGANGAGDRVSERVDRRKGSNLGAGRRASGWYGCR
jgi:hypothetical protein